MLDFLWLPFLACLVLTGIHVYLGLHVLARGVIFVDLALAQVAALGITVAFLAGHPIQSDAAYWYALAFTVGGAALFALSRVHRAPIPQEASSASSTRSRRRPRCWWSTARRRAASTSSSSWSAASSP